MKRYLLLGWVCMVAACGGGGGNSASDSEANALSTYALANAPGRMSAIGDGLDYSGHYEGTYYDGSGAADISGACRLGYYQSDVTINDVPQLLLKKFSCEGELSFSFAENLYVSIGSDTGVLRHYDSDGYYHNHPTGGIEMPATVTVGQSWSNSYYAVNYDAAYHFALGYPNWQYSELFVVEDIEFVRTAAGYFEAYRIRYTSDRDPSMFAALDGYVEHGTLWFYPGVGVVKREASGERGIGYNYAYRYELTSTNLMHLLTAN